VIPWTANRPEDMEALIDLGVVGLITDRPDLGRAAMARKGKALPTPTPASPDHLGHTTGQPSEDRKMTTQEIADRLVELCKTGKNLEAIDTLFSDKIVSVEALGDETMPAVMEGRAAVRGKNEWWLANHEVHAASADGPFPNGDRFAVIFDYEVTPKVGPQAGKRTRMKEVALYTIENGKIAREEFFYSI
jgi:hypothetical protein